MTQELKEYEKSIKRKHSIAWTPKYEAEFRTDLNKTVFASILSKVLEKLGWELLYTEEELVKAESKSSAWQWGQEINITYKSGKVQVKSVSQGSGFWDYGLNSKRVELFIHVFKETRKELTKTDLVQLEQEIERANNWDDYEIPKSLPKPKELREPNITFPIIGGILIALILAFVLAFLSVKGTYIIILFEVGVALAISFALGKLIKSGNYTNFDRLHYIY